MEDKQPAAGDLIAEAPTEAEGSDESTDAPTQVAEVPTSPKTRFARLRRKKAASEVMAAPAAEPADKDAEAVEPAEDAQVAEDAEATEAAKDAEADEDAEAGEVSEAAEGVEPEVIRFRSPRPAGRRTAIAVIVAAILFVGSAAFAGATMQPYLTDRAVKATKLTVARTAANAITALWTYTPENMDALADRAQAYLSGDFEAQYRRFVDAIVAPNKQAKVTNTTEVSGVGVESLDEPNAVAIVYTNTTSTSPLTKNVPSLKYLSYRLFMKRTNGHWLVNRMTTITSLDLTPHL